MPPLESETNPYLLGNYAPWREVGDHADLVVEGKVPAELDGTYYRNGPNPAFEPLGRYHWFDGDAMLHAVRLQGGRASYRNRYVMSAGLKEEMAAGVALHKGIFGITATEIPTFKNTGNTNIVSHAGRLMALLEAGKPTQLDPATLETLGEFDFDGRLSGPMTAHPHVDPVTGEMLFFGYSPFPPYLRYHVVDREGRLVRTENIDLAWPSMIHDFAITADHVLFILCPLVFDFSVIAQRGTPFVWDPERPTKIGVMPRTGGNADVRWVDTDPTYIFHPMNAYREDGGAFVMDVPAFRRLSFMDPDPTPRPDAATAEVGMMQRWTIDVDAGSVRRTPLDEDVSEFPRMDERRLGRPYRYGYAAARGPEDRHTSFPRFTGVRKYDLATGKIETRWFGAGNGVGEPVFVPRGPGAAEDDGYVLVLGHDESAGASSLWILDARDVAGEPVARVRMPHRVPYGFHGNWVAAA